MQAEKRAGPPSPESESQESKKIKVEEEKKVLGVTEDQVGITEFISSDIAGFRGILKQRYTDFLVNEIDLSGNVVHLTDVGLVDKKEARRQRRADTAGDNADGAAAVGTDSTGSDEKKTGETAIATTGGEIKTEVVADAATPASAGLNEKAKKLPEITDEQRERLVSLLGQEFVDKIFTLFNTGLKIISEKTIDDKEERTSVHQLLREAFNSRLESRTTPENQFIITLANNNTRTPRSKLDKSSMGSHSAYLHFVIYKENKETMEVANLISKFLRIPPKSITYAGTKDRRGVTVQRACVSKISVERVNGLNKALRGIKLGSFKYESGHLRLGDLKGNEFYITLREVEALGTESIEDIVTKSLTSLRDNGFINYFGMQRFGTFSISTHTVGKYVLNADWKKVVDLILSPQDLVLPESVEARKVWQETGDAKKALPLMPKRCVAEHAVLRSLAKDPKSYINAVSQIPRNLRVMYAHAYQSYIWNLVASERLKRYGLKIVPGDLVVDDSNNNGNDKKDSSQDVDEVSETEEYVRARVVTEEEIASGTKTIYDVVLPTPGFDVEYPGNDLRDVYRTVMESDGIDFLNMRRNIKEFSLAGNYRQVVIRPGNVEWWCKKYEASTDQFVKTDLELLNESLGEDARVSSEPGTGSKTALVIKLQLGPSQYATMALREVMKIDTSRRGDGLDVKNETNPTANK
ncbi:pseudouridine synthase PUS7 [Sugiyamaella lignohabitans]|uniref:Pseudouridine synthase PUS7 n=1 Tax=Sugiyamaella lignohabitans TaxID=796027 RepID=A0A167D5T6_9ASCO|nr:pseudouridine synthase PUS7 [Sugiyamaella lignohabitans]ANB12520.1 pseudouridine synthase PUS7 [Sugiyamaella lignohabitans]